MENIFEIVMPVLCALACLILAALLEGNRGRILQYTAQLINQVEETVQGSGMGAEKKVLVMAQLEAAGIHVNTWLATWIDETVDYLNANGAWLTSTFEH